MPRAQNTFRRRPFIASEKPTRKSATASIAIAVVYWVLRSFHVTRVSARVDWVRDRNSVSKMSLWRASCVCSEGISPPARLIAVSISSSVIGAADAPLLRASLATKLCSLRNASISASRPSSSCSPVPSTTFARSAPTAARVVSRAVFDSFTLALVCRMPIPAPRTTIAASVMAIQRPARPSDSSSSEGGVVPSSLSACGSSCVSSLMRRSPR